MITVAELINEYKKMHILITLDNETIKCDIRTSNIMETVYLLEEIKYNLLFEQDVRKNKIVTTDVIQGFVEELGKVIGDMQNKIEELGNKTSILENIVVPRDDHFFDKRKRK